MGKQTNANIVRFYRSKDWLSKYFCSFYNYSNLVTQDTLIHKYISNFMSMFNKFLFIGKNLELLLEFFRTMTLSRIGNLLYLNIEKKYAIVIV